MTTFCVITYRFDWVNYQLSAVVLPFTTAALTCVLCRVAVPHRVQNPRPVRDRLDRAPVAPPVRRRQGRVRAQVRQKPLHHILPHLQVPGGGQGELDVFCSVNVLYLRFGHTWLVRIYMFALYFENKGLLASVFSNVSIPI